MALKLDAAGMNNSTVADFEIRDLHVSVEGREILKGVSLSVNKGEVHAVMGPNGSGKSTLSHTLMGHPNYKVLGGQVRFKGKDILTLPPEQRTEGAGLYNLSRNIGSGAARDVVGIRCGAISGNMKVSFQAARSIG